MSEPRRVGLTELLRTSVGAQFVIPVYQRNYTWTPEREVKQYLNDLCRVLQGEYKNHFMGILIYLEKTIDFGSREFSVIDGQQRLTTTFLTIYAIREMFKRNKDLDAVGLLDGQFLTNMHCKDKIKYRLKPLVADDDVYRFIVEDRLEDIFGTEASGKELQTMRTLLSHIRKNRGITIEELSLKADTEYRLTFLTCSRMESEGIISTDLLQRCSIIDKKH